MKKAIHMIFWSLLLLLLVAQAWIRLAPSDPARWHQPVVALTDGDFDGGVLRSAPGRLADLDAVARNWPRTRVLAGSLAKGRITYISRSWLWGFPDYTTVQQRGDQLVIHARLRFGRKDFGVNRDRVEAWLQALPQL